MSDRNDGQDYEDAMFPRQRINREVDVNAEKEFWASLEADLHAAVRNEIAVSSGAAEFVKGWKP